MNIIWKKPDGSIAITHAVVPPEPTVRTESMLVGQDTEEGGVSTIVEKTPLRALYDTDMDTFLAAIAAAAQATDATLVDAIVIGTQLVLPPDRTFRGAWRSDATGVSIDMPVARTIHMDRIREARNKVLASKDREYMIADERGNNTDKQTIAAAKQVLRDIPATVDLSVATTPEQLDALWPVEVPRV